MAVYVVLVGCFHWGFIFDNTYSRPHMEKRLSNESDLA